MPRIETLTLNELASKMRELGISVSTVALSSAIEAGVYPFAIGYRDPEKGPSGHRHFEIYRKLFDQWVAERATDDGGAA